MSQPYLTLCTYMEPLAFLMLMKMQKISSIHSFILEIQQSSYDRKGTPIFDHVHPITVKVTFSFPEYVLECISMQPVS